MDNENKCAHKPCSCVVEDNEDYCSPQCESAAEQDITAIGCECEHAGCS